MKAYYINGETDEHGPIEVEPKLEEYYRLIGCRCVDFAVRQIGGTAYNIICDDEGLLEGKKVTAWSTRRNAWGEHEVLVGNLLIFGYDPDNIENGCKPLTDDDVLAIQRRMVMGIFEDGTEHSVLWY